MKIFSLCFLSCILVALFGVSLGFSIQRGSNNNNSNITSSGYGQQTQNFGNVNGNRTSQPTGSMPSGSSGTPPSGFTQSGLSGSPGNGAPPSGTPPPTSTGS